MDVPNAICGGGLLMMGGYCKRGLCMCSIYFVSGNNDADFLYV